MYQDTDTRTAAITTLLQPNATIPAQLAPYVPPPQPTYVPASSGLPGVVVNPDGSTHYGFAPVIYAQQQPLADPQAMARAMDRIGQGVQMIGAGGLAAGAGFGISEVIGAVAGAGAGALLGAAALIAVGALKGTRVTTVNHNNIREENHQHVSAVATGWFGKATSAVTHEKTFNSSTTVH